MLIQSEEGTLHRSERSKSFGLEDVGGKESGVGGVWHSRIAE